MRFTGLSAHLVDLVPLAAEVLRMCLGEVEGPPRRQSPSRLAELRSSNPSRDLLQRNMGTSGLSARSAMSRGSIDTGRAGSSSRLSCITMCSPRRLSDILSCQAARSLAAECAGITRNAIGRWARRGQMSASRAAGGSASRGRAWPRMHAGCVQLLAFHRNGTDFNPGQRITHMRRAA